MKKRKIVKTGNPPQKPKLYRPDRHLNTGKYGLPMKQLRTGVKRK